MAQPVFLAFGLFSALVEKNHRRKEHVFVGPWGASDCRDGVCLIWIWPGEGTGLFVPLGFAPLDGAVLLTRSIGLLSMRAWQRRGD